MEPLHTDEEQERWADSMTTVCVSTPLRSFLSPNDTRHNKLVIFKRYHSGLIDLS